MWRNLSIFILIMVCGVLNNGYEVNAATSDIEGLYFEMLLNHLVAFEERVQVQIDRLSEQMDEIKAEINNVKGAISEEKEEIDVIKSGMRKLQEEFNVTKNELGEGVREVLADTQWLRNMHESMNKKIDNSESAIRHSQTALQQIRNECTGKDVFLDTMKDQTNRLRKIERGTVVYGRQQVDFQGNKYNVFVDSSNVLGFDGGWYVFQKRFDGSLNFNRNWNDYKNGFGSINGEHWLGLEPLYRILQTGRYELLIVVEAHDGDIGYEHYDNFKIANEAMDYKITSVGSYTGNAGRAFEGHLGGLFSTYDNDVLGKFAYHNGGGWWFKTNYDSFLNGDYTAMNKFGHSGIRWYNFKDFEKPLKKTKMMVRPYQVD